MHQLTGINTIIFDLGKVLIKWDPKNLFRKIFEQEEEMDYFLENICTSEWNAKQDAGRTWAEAVDLLVTRHPAYEKQIYAYWKRWPEMLGGPIHGTVEILQEFESRKQHRLLALTNWSAETWPIALAQFDFLQIFEGILVSGEEHLKKPDLRIYQLLFERYQVDPLQALFIDDSLANVEAARSLGLQAIHFRSPEQLRADLLAAELIS